MIQRATTDFERMPPCDKDAERAVIGSILLLPDVLDDVALIVEPDDFYEPAHNLMFASMLDIFRTGKKLDAKLLAVAMKKAGTLEQAGGTLTIAEAMQSVPTAAHAVHYAEVVREKSLLRSVARAGSEMSKAAYDESSEARDVVARSEAAVFAISERSVRSESKTAINEILMDAMIRLDARRSGNHVASVPTGFRDLDKTIVGLHKSELTILAARPSMGKSALALNIATYAASNNYPTLFFSMEMPAVDLGERMLCSAANVDLLRCRNATLSGADRESLVEMSAALAGIKFEIDDRPNRTLTEISSIARRAKRKSGLSLIVIDYLQLIQPDNTREPRQEQVAKIARRLKGLSRELHVPVLCLAQLNRQADEGGNKRPKLSHLRESGAIEQDADVVMFVHRDDYFDDSNPATRGIAEVIVAKQRNGPVGTVKLSWHKESTRFADLFKPTHVQDYDEFEFRG